MIRVDRGEAPPGFDADSQAWWAEYQGLNPRPAAGTFWSKVRGRAKVQKVYGPVLLRAFANKCAFCESHMEHVSPGQIEHYRPKGDNRFTDLMFRWDNWLLACSRCNTKKGDRFPDCGGQPCLIDPSHEEPGEHLEFAEDKVVAKTERGKETIKLTGLDRSKLEEQRGRWLWYVDSLLVLCKVPLALDAARELLIWAKQEDAPYTAMTRCYLQRRVPTFAQKHHPRVAPAQPVEQIRALIAQYQTDIDAVL
jgi:hypothetical protein